MKLIKIITLLALVTLFMGCDLSFEPENPALNGGGEKIAQVKVSISSNARTILPEVNGFNKYVLSAESADSSQNSPAPVAVDGNAYSGTMAIPYGEWIITVTAYVNIEGTDYAAVKGSVPLTVNNSSHSIIVPVNTPEPGGVGTFTYTVKHPSAGSASVKLEPWPLGQTALFNETASNGVQTIKNNVPSGMYFLTVTATANSKTVTRNEIVHIYHQSTTNAEYAFTKLVFGYDLNISGTVKVLVNGVQPSQARVYCGTNQYSLWEFPINFTGNDGSGIWSITFDDSGVGGATTLYFWAGPSFNMRKELQSISIPVDDTTDIDLGIVEFTAPSLPADTWVEGDIYSNGGDDYYSLNISSGTKYYLWFNNAFGDGSKTLHGNLVGISNNGYQDFYTQNAWFDPVSFTANDSGTLYIRVGGSNTGTYAIGYSTDAYWHNNSLNSANAVPLSSDIWHNGAIITPYAANLYSINVIEGATYYFWWDTQDIGVNAYTSDLDYIFGYSYRSAQTDPVSFTADYSGTVYIRVMGNWDNTGTYAIKYSSNIHWWNNPLNPANAVPLTADTWHDGNITTPYVTDLYSINATEETTYYFWLNSISSNGDKTLYGVIQALHSNGDQILRSENAWFDPMSFTAIDSGTVYIRVMGNWGNTGTYAIGYSTDAYWWNNSLNPANPANATITIDTWNTYQYIRGYGGMDATTWTNFQEISIQDYETMYDPDKLGYNILRVMIPSDNTDIAISMEELTTTYRPNYYEGVKRVNQYGGYVLATPWSPPAAWKTNNSITGDGSLKYENYQDYADYLKSYAQHMYDKGAPIYVVSMQNEPTFKSSYDGCEFSTVQHRNWWQQVGNTFFTNPVPGWGGGQSIPRVLTMTGEAHGSVSPFHTDSTSALQTSDARQYIDIVGRHIYGAGINYLTNEQRHGKEVWMTEYNINSGEGGYNDDSTWNYVWRFMNAIDLTIRLNNENTFIWWIAKRFYSMIGDGQYGTIEGEILPRGWGMSHYAKYSIDTTRIGFTMTGTTADGTAISPTNVNANYFSPDNPSAKITAFVSQDGNEISLVMWTPTDTNGSGGFNMGKIKIDMPDGFEINSATGIRSSQNEYHQPYTPQIADDRRSAYVTLPRGQIMSVKFTR